MNLNEIAVNLERGYQTEHMLMDDNITTLTSWQESDGWYFCLSGTYNGLYSESDDGGPMGSREIAIEEGKDWYTILIKQHGEN